jgi:hypothetical protein
MPDLEEITGFGLRFWVKSDLKPIFASEISRRRHSPFIARRGMNSDPPTTARNKPSRAAQMFRQLGSLILDLEGIGCAQRSRYLPRRHPTVPDPCLQQFFQLRT